MRQLCHVLPLPAAEHRQSACRGRCRMVFDRVLNRQKSHGSKALGTARPIMNSMWSTDPLPFPAIPQRGMVAVVAAVGVRCGARERMPEGTARAILDYLRRRRGGVSVAHLCHDLALAPRPAERELAALIAAGKVRRLGAKVAAVPIAARRKCLSCGACFASEGPWNRICPSCSEADEGPPVRRVHHVHLEIGGRHAE